ncbi:MAG: type II toxin-antitoxin system VapC family toxin [Deltaproteobacteria bacterium]|nr:type II toxin-antitoxin system VapC family toxin [Deltaproteobacteria bacterium]
MIIADTDVLIDFLKGAGATADRIEFELKQGLCTTVISAFELWSGAVGSSKRETAVNILLDALTIVPCKPFAAREAAKIRYDLQKEGRTIGMADSLIAGICVTERSVLLTRNKKHFSKIAGLYLGEIH